MEFAEFYSIVKRVALGMMHREGRDHSWSASDAAHEVILRGEFGTTEPVDVERLARWRLSRMLISKARRRHVRWRVEESLARDTQPWVWAAVDQVVVEDFLCMLDRVYPRHRLGEIARLQRVGFSTKEIAGGLDMALRTVERRIRMIRDLARRHFGRDSAS